MTTTELPVVALATLQFSWGGLIDAIPTDIDLHLVRRTARGTPGPTLCGIDRFALESPGWSVGGGVTGPNVTHGVCSGCLNVARGEFTGLPVVGMFAAYFERRLALIKGPPAWACPTCPRAHSTLEGAETCDHGEAQ